MAIQWTEDLATGIDEIDDQHRELFDRINRLLAACNQGKGREEIGITVSFLEDYVVTHFSAEERTMLSSRFPAYAVHRSEHARFTAGLKDLRRQLDEEGPGIRLVILTNRIVVGWLKSHIRSLDKSFGAYLRANRL